MIWYLFLPSRAVVLLLLFVVWCKEIEVMFLIALGISYFGKTPRTFADVI